MLYSLTCYISLFIFKEPILILIENKHNFYSFQQLFIQHNYSIHFYSIQHFIQSPTKMSIPGILG